MIYVSGEPEWLGRQTRVLKEERDKLLKMPYINQEAMYINQEAMCRIAEIGSHIDNIDDFAHDYRDKEDVTEKSPLSESIRNEPFPVGFQLPTFDTYDGTSDPEDHLHAVKSVMQLQNASDALICRVFPTTLRGRARCWFYAMAPDSILRFKTLAKAFLNRFARENRVWKQSDELWYVKQRKGELLKGYLARFNEMESDVNLLDGEVAVACLRQGLRDEHLKKSLSYYPPKSFAEAKEQIENYVRAEESAEEKQRAESYPREEMNTKKRGGYQYRGGRKKAKRVFEYGRVRVIDEFTTR